MIIVGEKDWRARVAATRRGRRGRGGDGWGSGLGGVRGSCGGAGLGGRGSIFHLVGVDGPWGMFWMRDGGGGGGFIYG